MAPPGWGPDGRLILDQEGDLYGTTFAADQGGEGTVFELVRAGNNWTYQLLYSLNYSGPQESRGRVAVC